MVTWPLILPLSSVTIPKEVVAGKMRCGKPLTDVAAGAADDGGTGTVGLPTGWMLVAIGIGYALNALKVTPTTSRGTGSITCSSITLSRPMPSLRQMVRFLYWPICPIGRFQ